MDWLRIATATLALALATSSGLAWATPVHAAAVIEVTTTADGGPGSLRDALARAEATPSDDQITFAPSVSGTIQLTSGQLDVAVGESSGNLSVDGPGQDVLAVDARWQSRVLDVHGPGGDTRPAVTVSGLTLTGGFTSGTADEGGALRAVGTDVVLDRMVVSNSRTYSPGGGVALQRGSLLVTASTITGNDSMVDVWGGGDGAGGGGIFFDGGDAAGTALAVRDSTISDNTAYSRGGGIHSQGPAPVTVTGSTVSGNTADYTWRGMDVAGVVGEGGGISADHIAVVDSRVTGNEAGERGGGLNGSSVVVTGSTIDDNLAGDNGGGLFIGTELRLDSSTVTANRADLGGGLYVGSDVELTLSTVAANLAVVGGGLYSNADVALQGTMVGMNAGGDLAGEGSAALTRSLVRDPRGFRYVDSGGSIIGEDPLLGSLADHGGPSATLLPASNSPAIDQGSGFGVTTDQRGLARPVDDTNSPDAVDGSDIGAVELSEAELAGVPQVGNTGQPTIVGRARVGETLRTDGGTWEPGGVSLSHQWLRDGVPISGATAASYTLTPEDFGRSRFGEDLRKRVSVHVTSAAVGHREGSMTSDYTRPVVRGVVVVSRPAQVTGGTKVGSVLRARPHLRAVSPRRPGTYVRWYLNNRSVGSAGGQRQLKLVPRMRGKRVKVVFSYAASKGYIPLVQVVQKRRRVR